MESEIEDKEYSWGCFAILKPSFRLLDIFFTFNLIILLMFKISRIILPKTKSLNQIFVY